MSLVAKFTADTAQFEKGIKNAQGVMENGKATAEKLDATLGKLKTAFAGVVTVAGIAKITSAVKGLADSTATAADRIDKQSQALGMSRKAYQQWDYILGQSGASIDSLGVSMKTLNNSLLNPSDGTITALDTLGVNLEQIQGLSQEDAFEMMVRQFQKMPEGATKSALAMQMFGKQGQALMPLLNSTSDTIDNLRKDMERMGFEMSDSMVDAGVKYGDTMDNLKRTLEGVKNILGYGLMESLTGIAEEMTKFFSNQDVQDAVKRLAVNIHDMGAVVLSHVQEFFEWLNSNGATLSEALGSIASFIGDIATAVGGFAVETLQEIVGAFTEFFNTASPQQIAAVAGLAFTLGLLFFPVQTLAGAALALAANWKSVKEWAGNAAQSLDSWKDEKLADVKQGLTNLNEKFSGIGESVDKAREWVKAFFTTGEIPEGTPQWLAGPIGAVQDAWDWITDAVDTAISSINGFFNGSKLENVQLPEWATTVLGGIRDAWDWITDAADTVVATISGFFNGEGLENIVLPEWVTTVLGGIQEAWDWITDAADTVKSTINDFFENVKPTLPEWLQTVLTPIEVAWDAITTAVDKVKSAVTTFFTTSFPDPPWKGIVDGIITTFNNVTAAIQGAIEKLGAWMGARSSGGSGIPAVDDYLASQQAFYGNAAGLDYVPRNGYRSILHEGEAVLNKRDAEEWRRGENKGASAADIAEAVFAAFEGMSVMMDGSTVGKLTAKTVSREIEREARAGRFATA